MRYLSGLLALVILAGCAGLPAAASPDLRPTSAPAATAEQRAVVATGQPLSTAAALLQAPTTAPMLTVAPTPPASNQQPTSAPTFDVDAQSAALVPEAQSDLANAGAWNRYTIEATIDPTARTITGRQRLDYTNRDTVPLGQIYFHLYPNLRDLGGRLTVSAMQVNGQSVPVVYERANLLLRVNLTQLLAPGETVTVQLDFTARTPLNASRTFYGAFNKENGVLALASAYPIAAVVRGGTWDIAGLDTKGDLVNSETALYDVTLTAPNDWPVAATGVPVDVQQSDGQRRTRFVSGPQRDFTIALTQLATQSVEVDGTRITSYYRNSSVAGGKIALDVAANAVRVFNKRFGRYPLRELDVVQFDARKFLGVEYPGITFIDASLYARPQTLEQTVAHEVAHQWWYSLVGNDVQRAAWLDEALASYSQVVYAEEILGAAAAQRELEGFRRAYRSVRDAPVQQATGAYGRNYFGIVYGKGALFFQALRRQIGEQAFDRFLHDYYAQHRYGYVTGDNLLASAEGACACQLDNFYRDWILRAVPVQVP